MYTQLNVGFDKNIAKKQISKYYNMSKSRNYKRLPTLTKSSYDCIVSPIYAKSENENIKPRQVKLPTSCIIHFLNEIMIS